MQIKERFAKSAKRGFALILLSSIFLISGCNDPDASEVGEFIGTDQVTGTPQPVPEDPNDGNGEPNSDHDSSTRVGESCHSSDPNKICLALKYVVYKNSAGAPVVTTDEAIQNVMGINALWGQCNIAFEIGKYVAVNPGDYGFEYNTSQKTYLGSIRNKFEEDDTLLVVTTGTWSGSLGSLSTNAWTMMPGSSTNGVVLEATVAKSPRLIAHELGHYLNLDHYSSTSNMMNPVIYTSSTALTSSQCSTARSAAKYYWSAMYR